MPDWPVLVWSASTPIEREPSAAVLQDRNLVLLLDDLPYFVAATSSGLGPPAPGLADAAARLRTLIPSLSASNPHRLVIVATCRIEGKTTCAIWPQLAAR